MLILGDQGVEAQETSSSLLLPFALDKPSASFLTNQVRESTITVRCQYFHLKAVHGYSTKQAVQ